jgi:hypothetical protein
MAPPFLFSVPFLPGSPEWNAEVKRLEDEVHALTGGPLSSPDEHGASPEDGSCRARGPFIDMLKRLNAAFNKQKPVIKEVYLCATQYCSRVFADVDLPKRLSMPGPGRDFRLEWSAIIVLIHWLFRFWPVLGTFLFGDRRLVLDSGVGCFEEPPAWGRARAELLEKLSPLGLGDLLGWSDGGTIITAVHKITQGVFRHANLALQRDPCPGTSAEKLAVLDFTASRLVAVYSEMSCEERCVFPEAAVRIFALQVRSYRAEYPWAATAADFAMLLSPAYCNLTCQHGSLLQGYRLWVDYPRRSSDLERMRGEFARSVLFHVMEQGNAVRWECEVGDVFFDPAPWARPLDGLDPDRMYGEFVDFVRDPLSGPDELSVRARSLFDQIPEASLECPFPREIPEFQLAFVKKFAASRRSLFRVVQGILCATGAEPVCERYGSYLWYGLGDRRGQARGDLILGELILKSWSRWIAEEILRRLLTAHVRSRKTVPMLSLAPRKPLAIERELLTAEVVRGVDGFACSCDVQHFLAAVWGVADEEALSFTSVWPYLPFEIRRSFTDWPRVFGCLLSSWVHFSAGEGDSISEIAETLESAWLAVSRTIGEESRSAIFFFADILVWLPPVDHPAFDMSRNDLHELFTEHMRFSHCLSDGNALLALSAEVPRILDGVTDFRSACDAVYSASFPHIGSATVSRLIYRRLQRDDSA